MKKLIKSMLAAICSSHILSSSANNWTFSHESVMFRTTCFAVPIRSMVDNICLLVIMIFQKWAQRYNKKMTRANRVIVENYSWFFRRPALIGRDRHFPKMLKTSAISAPSTTYKENAFFAYLENIRIRKIAKIRYKFVHFRAIHCPPFCILHSVY